MAFMFLAQVPNTPDVESPTVWRDDNGDLIVQGYVGTGEDYAQAAVRLPLLQRAAGAPEAGRPARGGSQGGGHQQRSRAGPQAGMAGVHGKQDRQCGHSAVRGRHPRAAQESVRPIYDRAQHFRIYSNVYVPSCDAGAVKTERKRRFIQACRDHLPSGGEDLRLIVGDFNVLEPDHKPRYRIFRSFEYDFYRWFATAGYSDAWRSLKPEGDPPYSWVGRTGDGYRYDHAFSSAALHPRLAECEYVDETRTGEAALSDHSALSVRLTLGVEELLLVSDPTASDQQALF